MASRDPLGGVNLPYVEELYARYLADPDSVDADWQGYFADLHDGANGNGAGEARRAVAGPAGRSWLPRMRTAASSPVPSALASARSLAGQPGLSGPTAA